MTSVQDRVVGPRADTDAVAILLELCKLPMGELKKGNGNNSDAQAGDMNSEQGNGSTEYIESSTIRRLCLG